MFQEEENYENEFTNTIYQHRSAMSSFRKEKFKSFKSSSDTRLSYTDKMPDDEIYSLFHEVLLNGIHGLCFSLYEEGQGPGDVISEDQIRRRMEILQPYTKWIRTFSCTDGNDKIPVIAKEYGIKTLVGAWLGNEADKNEEEITNLIKLAEQGYVDIAAVGNEVLYRNDLQEHELLAFISKVKDAMPDDIPVGYVDAYYEFVQRPAITELCDVILCNCYPYWEGTHFNDSLEHMSHMYNQVKSVAGDKEVIISETGWPSEGTQLGGGVPNKENAMRYFINSALWSEDENIKIFYFSSFDESWKTGSEGDVGAYWGIWDKDRKLKY